MSKDSSLQQLRAHAISHTMCGPTTLGAAVAHMGFVQADPIRAPAPAQDLILRHRVESYRNGDLLRHYATLGMEEGNLYAYGFMPHAVWRLRQHSCDPTTLPELEQRVLDVVRERGPSHPKELRAQLGQGQVTNAWGGRSQATTRALESLHWHGLVRVAWREKNVRLYEAAPAPEQSLSRRERYRKLMLIEANILGPVTERTLDFVSSGLGRISFPDIVPRRRVARDIMRELIQEGALQQRTVGGISYVWPAPGVLSDIGIGHEGAAEVSLNEMSTDEAPQRVRFLAPFDPLVWDRERFQYLWGWDYRFEAYTPAEKRVRGYYAMPLLWGDRVIGWANAGVIRSAQDNGVKGGAKGAQAGGKLDVELGFVEKQPRERAFRSAVDAEVARLEAFLRLDKQGLSTADNLASAAMTSATGAYSTV